MSELKAKHPVSLQILFNEELYLIDPVLPPNTEKFKQAANAGSTASDATAQINPILPALASPNQLNRGTPEEKAGDLVFDYLGDNNKYLLLLVDDERHPFMDTKELEALQSILAAKKWN